MYNNPYLVQPQRFQNIEPMPQPQFNNTHYVQPMQPIQPTTNQSTLLGKSVDSIDVVKAMDIPLDGSISYFPLADGTAIVSKQLQMDGTSKMVVYKPVKDKKEETIRYVTVEEVNDIFEDFEINDMKDIKDELRKIKNQIEKLKNTNKK